MHMINLNVIVLREASCESVFAKRKKKCEIFLPLVSPIEDFSSLPSGFSTMPSAKIKTKNEYTSDF